MAVGRLAIQLVQKHFVYLIKSQNATYLNEKFKWTLYTSCIATQYDYSISILKVMYCFQLEWTTRGQFNHYGQTGTVLHSGIVPEALTSFFNDSKLHPVSVTKETKRYLFDLSISTEGL